MASLNKVFLMGNLTRDPELRYLPSGQAVCQLRLAVNRRYKTQEGELKDDTCFVDVVIWGRRGEVVNQYLSKGSPIFVEGRLQLDQWEDKASGEPRSKLQVIAENFEFIGGRQGQGPSGGPDEVDASDAPPPRARPAMATRPAVPGAPVNRAPAPRPVPPPPAPAADPGAPAAARQPAAPAAGGDEIVEDDIPF